MTLEEAFTKFASTRSHGLPWEIGADDLRAIFTAGWHAHYESTRQTDMFPGTLNANVAQSVEQLFCKQPVASSILAVGSTFPLLARTPLAPVSVSAEPGFSAVLEKGSP